LQLACAGDFCRTELIAWFFSQYKLQNTYEEEHSWSRSEDFSLQAHFFSQARILFFRFFYNSFVTVHGSQSVEMVWEYTY